MRIHPHHAGFLLCLMATACRVEVGAAGHGSSSDGAELGAVLLYTSMYRPVVEALEAALKEDLPQIRTQWFQGGSEKVAARLDAEITAGACPADLLLTSDPAHFVRLKKEGRLAPHVPPGALRVPRALLDPDGAFITHRISTMVLAWHRDEPHPPTRMAQLWSDAFRGEAILGDPLASGTFFSTLAVLEMVHGPPFFDGLRAAQVVATGGNSAVQEKLLNREKRAGLLLLENALAAQAAGLPLAWRIPEDGVVLVPGPVAVLRDAPHPRAAMQVEDWLLGQRAQRIMVDVGLMHAAWDGSAPPRTAPPLEELLGKALKLSPQTWESLSATAADVKARFGHAYGR